MVIAGEHTHREISEEVVRASPNIMTSRNYDSFVLGSSRFALPNQFPSERCATVREWRRS
jgi:hypothetical protein